MTTYNKGRRNGTITAVMTTYNKGRRNGTITAVMTTYNKGRRNGTITAVMTTYNKGRRNGTITAVMTTYNKGRRNGTITAVMTTYNKGRRNGTITAAASGTKNKNKRGGGGKGIYIAVVVLDVGALEHYMFIGIHNYVDMMCGCRYGYTVEFSHRSEQRAYNKAILTKMRHAPCWHMINILLFYACCQLFLKYMKNLQPFDHAPFWHLFLCDCLRCGTWHNFWKKNEKIVQLTSCCRCYILSDLQLTVHQLVIILSVCLMCVQMKMKIYYLWRNGQARTYTSS